MNVREPQPSKSGQGLHWRIGPLDLWGKAFTYGFTVLLLVMVLRALGFKLTALLGAAGVAGAAIGFASQTSLSNLISGIFLILEKPFQVGDVQQLGDTPGLVHSIDLLSVKLRTFDNRYIRIPNETLVKPQFTNVTRFPIRIVHEQGQLPTEGKEL